MATATAERSVRSRRGPVDPRLWRYSRSARRYLILTVVLSVIGTGAVIVTALLIAAIVSGVITDPTRRDIGSWTVALGVLAAAIGARIGVTWLQGRYGHRAASRVIAELQDELLAASVALTPRELDSRRAELTVVLTRGIGDLRGYLAGYLPALVLAVVVPPAVLVVMAAQDLVSAAIVFFTLPLIPIFMILIGLLTKGRSRATLTALTTLSAQLLDLLAGLPTLRALGRERGPQSRIRELGDDHRRTTMSALRIAFLSSMVLELLATLSVALVAVSIGLRLVFGEMGLEAGLAALILAPEVYAPLRTMGERFHAAEDGMAVADKAFAVLGTQRAPADSGAGRRPSQLAGVITFDSVSVRARKNMAPSDLTGVALPGKVTVLTGANGSGKSTALQTILGLTNPDRGKVLIDGTDVAALDKPWLWSQIAWLPQRPVLIPGTLRENLELTGPVVVSDGRLADACAATGFDSVLAEQPAGWDTVLGAGGTGLSLGQRQRLALTRVIVSGKPILLLDEPTAHLDEASEAEVLRALSRRAAEGDTVVVVGHRPAVLAAADLLVEVADDGRE